MGDTTLDVRRRLACEGVTPSGKTMPDHLGIELAFMAHLAAREGQARDDGDNQGAREYLTRQESFLHDHLIGWLPLFCRRVLAGRPLAHYADLVRCAETFVTDDVVQIRTWLGNRSATAASVKVESEWWSVNVGQGCTLCDICAQVCRPGALSQARLTESGAVSLRFEPALCDGCAACEYWCPEKVIYVDRALDGDRPISGELVRSAMLSCPRCGQLHAPAAMVAKVQTQVGVQDEALVEWLALCHGCRVKSVPWRSGNTDAACQFEGST
jgi:ferredoxin